MRLARAPLGPPELYRRLGGALWDELRASTKPLFLFDIAMPVIARTGDNLHRLTILLDHWVRAGWVRARGKPIRYRLKKKVQAMTEPPPLALARPKYRAPRMTQRQRLWTAMRVLRSFDMATLLITAQASPATASDMLRIFERLGWVTRNAEGRFTIDTARRWPAQVPTIMRHLVDGNTHIRVSMPSGGTVHELPVQPRALCNRSAAVTSRTATDGG